MGAELADQLRNLAWLEPWEPCEPGLEPELQREIGSPDHPLYGRPATAVGRRRDMDEVLFALSAGPAPLAVVHLTWASRPETRPEWPDVSLYDSVDDWVEHGMRVDAADFPAAIAAPPAPRPLGAPHASGRGWRGLVRRLRGWRRPAR